jgi:hypothetical protein
MLKILAKLPWRGPKGRLDGAFHPDSPMIINSSFRCRGTA